MKAYIEKETNKYMAAKRGLGKGLDTLIPAGEGKGKNNKEVEIQKADMNVPIAKVEPNPDQPRRNFDEDQLEELADSIKQHGIFQPILVKDVGSHYMIVAGERRWRAALKAGLKEVPVIVRDYSEEEIVIISLLENIQRADLNPIEEAQTYKKLIDKHHFKQDEVAEKVSKSRTAVTNSLRLLKLSDEVQQMLIDSTISSGHARALLAVEDKEKQYELAQRVMDERLSVREIEKIIKDLNKPKKEIDKKKKELEFLYRDLEEKIKINIGSKVVISPKDENKGKIEIEYYSQEDLERLVDFLTTSVD